MAAGYTIGWRLALGAAVVPVAIAALPLALAAQVLSTRPGAAPEAEVTFTRHIAPILQRSCENCHRQDGVAPMALSTYEEVRPGRARSSSAPASARTRA